MDDDSAAIISFAGEAGHLKRLPRSGWLQAHIADPESVAEHSFRVAVLAFAIAAQEGADPEHAACLGLFHDMPETRTGDIASAGRPYVSTTDPRAVIADQTADLPEFLAQHIRDLVTEHEGAKTPAATPEAMCSRDADKLECLIQAREYQAAGNTMMQPWIDSMLDAVRTESGQALAKAALELPPSAWWDRFAAAFTARIGSEAR